MTITKRTLEKWRREALKQNIDIIKRNVVEENWTEPILNCHEVQALNARIIGLTQELLDQHLLNKE